MQSNSKHKIRFASLCLMAVGATAPLLQAATPPEEIVIPGDKVFPESITSAADGTVYTGGIVSRTIFRAKPGAATAEAWVAPATDNTQGIFGVFVDESAKTLWACFSNFGPPQAGVTPPPAALHVFDLKSGKAKGAYPFPTAGGMCNDIAVGADGTAYATDTANMQVVRLKKGAKDVEVWTGSNGEFGAKGGVLDGIAVIKDRVLVNTLLTSKLFSVSIGKDGKAGTATEVKLDRPLERPDGMRSFGKDSLLVVEGGGGGKLSRVDLDGDTGKVSTIKEGFPGGPVGVAVVGSTAYVLEGQLMLLMRPSPDAKPAPFHAVAVPVGKP